ncbi:MAG: hypothetical protein WCI55_14350 [Armatimonadota bacterium]
MLTIAGIAFTVLGAVNHRSIYLEQKYAANRAEKIELSQAQMRQYFWLKVTAIILFTGLPGLCIDLLINLPNNRFSTEFDLWVVFGGLNLPGVVYCIQAVFVRLSIGTTLKLPYFL